MKIIESYLTNHRCYKSDRRINVKGLMLHSVGVNQPSASVFVNSWDTDSKVECVHAFIDANTGNVHQTLPWTYRANHCGGSGNSTHISVEICEPHCIKYTSGSLFTCSDITTAKKMVKRTYDSAVKLFAKLCIEYGLNPLANGVIVSHHEGYATGIALNHGDPEHLWNGLGTGYTMDKFRKDVNNLINKPFLVKVSTDHLNMRTGPSTKYSRIGYIPVGVFTIVGVNGAWGKLKSQQLYKGKLVDAWIHMGYVTKL